MSSLNDIMTINCPKCGYIHRKNIELYNSKLRKQSFGISPILPTCSFCGSEVTFDRSNICSNDRKVIALTGTCASGKSATAEMLMQQYGFDVIDGDCVMQVVKHKMGINKIEFDAPEMYEEIEVEIDILLSFQRDIVISHVITPGDINIYREIFNQRKLNYKIFLLHPRYASAIARSKTRTCHNSITPEQWVKYFYEELSVFKDQNNGDVIIFNNSDYSVEESVKKIMEEYYN